MYQVLAILDNLLIHTDNAKRMRLASTVFLRPGKQKSRQRDPIHTQMRFRKSSLQCSKMRVHTSQLNRFPATTLKYRLKHF